MEYRVTVPARGFSRAEMIFGEAESTLKDGILGVQGQLEADGVQIIRLTCGNADA